MSCQTTCTHLLLPVSAPVTQLFMFATVTAGSVALATAWTLGIAAVAIGTAGGSASGPSDTVRALLNPQDFTTVSALALNEPYGYANDTGVLNPSLIKSVRPPQASVLCTAAVVEPPRSAWVLV